MQHVFHINFANRPMFVKTKLHFQDEMLPDEKCIGL